jgi:hypothetical protein
MIWGHLLEINMEEVKAEQERACTCPAFGGVNDFCPIHGEYLKGGNQQRKMDGRHWTMTEFKYYRRSQIAEMRPYAPGEVLSDDISVSALDRDNGSPKEGDMIARNPKNHQDQWLVAAKYFADNFAAERDTEIERLQAALEAIDDHGRAGSFVEALKARDAEIERWKEEVLEAREAENGALLFAQQKLITELTDALQSLIRFNSPNWPAVVELINRAREATTSSRVT